MVVGSWRLIDKNGIMQQNGNVESSSFSEALMGIFHCVQDENGEYPKLQPGWTLETVVEEPHA